MTLELFAMSGAAFGRGLLSLILIITVGRAASSGLVVGKRQASWCSIVGFTLTGHVYNTTLSKTHKQCWNACKVQPHCISANFESGSGRCDLNDASHYDHSAGLSEGRGWVYTYTQIQSVGCATLQSLTNKEAKVEPYTSWAHGTHGLPMPTAGCPIDSGFTWETGYRIHDTENYNPGNSWYEVPHLKGPYAGNDMSQHFCMKTVDRVSHCDVDWPLGEYCVFQFGENCPINMSPGSIYWDDEDTDNHNAVNGTVPSGVYDGNTLINYCCMVTGSASDPIALPTHSPFYLFAYTEQCQEVEGMTVSQEWFSWDDEDSGNGNYDDGNHPYDSGSSEGHKLYYCYYE